MSLLPTSEDKFNELLARAKSNSLWINEIEKEKEQLINALRSIDNHIRLTSEPIPYIIEELKKILPDYNGTRICVGDILHIGEGSNNNECTNVVAVFENNMGVMGLGSTPLSKLNILSIVQSHKELKSGDELYNGYFKVKEFIK